jgi:hypothetical protein
MWNTDYYGHPMDYAWWWIVLGSLGLHAWCFFRFTKKRGGRALGLVAGSGLVAICLLQFAGLVGETYFRFFDMDAGSYAGSLASKRWAAMHVRLNDLGHRDEPHAEAKVEGRRRIAFVGDSVTFGWGIDRAEDRFPDIIGARFEEGSPGAVEVFNAAGDGWGTGDELAEIQRLIERYAVDGVVLCYGLDDIDEVLPAETAAASPDPSDGHLVNTEGSYLLSNLYHRWASRRSVEVSSQPGRFVERYDDPGSWRLQQARFDEIMGRCRRFGVALRVVIVPSAGAEGSGPVREKVASHFEAAGVEVLDLESAIVGREPGALVMNRYDHHPDERAHRLYADTIWEAFYVGRNRHQHFERDE